MHLARQKSHADAEFYKLKQEAEVNRVLYTPEYLELKKYESLAQNNKVYFGNQIPHTYLSSSCDGFTVNRIINEIEKAEQLIPDVINKEDLQVQEEYASTGDT